MPRAIGQHMAAIRPALVHLNDTVRRQSGGGAGRPAAAVARDLPSAGRWTSATIFDRWLSRSLAGYVCISHAVDAHQRTLGGRVEPSWVVYNGLDLADMDQPVDAAEVRAELGLGRDDEVVGCVRAAVSSGKGQRVFLEGAGPADHRPSPAAGADCRRGGGQWSGLRAGIGRANPHAGAG
jgi:hypothetical protein